VTAVHPPCLLVLRSLTPAKDTLRSV